MNFKCAVLPFIGKGKLLDTANRIAYELNKQGFNACVFKEGLIGDRYREQDRVHTPYCITVDATTLENDTICLRYRTSKTQIRIKTTNLPQRL